MNTTTTTSTTTRRRCGTRTVATVTLLFGSAVVLGGCAGSSTRGSAASDIPATAGLLPVVAAAQNAPCTGSGFQSYAAVGPDNSGLHRAEIDLTYCGTGSYRMDRYPTLTLLDAHGRTIAGTLRRDPADAGNETQLLRHGFPICAVLTWPATTATAVDGATQVVVAGGSGRAAFTTALPLGVDVGTPVTLSSWVPSSDECLGSG